MGRVRAHLQPCVVCKQHREGGNSAETPELGKSSHMQGLIIAVFFLTGVTSKTPEMCLPKQVTL